MFIASPVLAILPAPDKWMVYVPATWQSRGLRFTILKGWITDLASIPQAFRAAFDVNGNSRCPALFHDWLYNTQYLPREKADDLFRSALLFYGVSPPTANLYWLGVRAGGEAVWNARLARGGGLQLDDFATPADFQAAVSTPNLGFEMG